MNNHPTITPADLAAKRRPRLRPRGATRCGSSTARGTPSQRHARLHRRRQVRLARLDGVDAGLPVRLRDPRLRRDRRPRAARARPAAHAAAHGPARHARRRARPRVQQPLDLRQPPPAHARGTHPAQRVGAELLRDGDQGQRRRAGGAVVRRERLRRRRQRRRVAAAARLRLLVQRPALAVHRHDADDPHHGRRPPARPRPRRARTTGGSTCSGGSSCTA